MGFAERNIASSFEFTQKLLQAKEPKDEAKELGKRVAKMTGQGTQR